MLGPEDQALKDRHEDASAETLNELLDMLRVLRGALQLPHELPGGAAGFDGLDPKIREGLAGQDNDFAADAGDLPSPEEVPGLADAVADFAKRQRPWYKRVFDAVAEAFRPGGADQPQDRAADERETLKPPKQLSPEAVLKRLEKGEPVENIRREMNVAQGPVTPATLAQAHNQVVRFLEKLWQVDLPENVRTDSGFGWRIEALERLCHRLLNIRGGGKVSVVNDESGIGIYVAKDEELTGTGGWLAEHLCWAKGAPGWVTGSSGTLDPCDEDGNDNGKPNITGYVVSPTGKAITYVEITTDDIVGYLPFGENKGLIVTVIHGGTYTTPKTMLPAIGATETLAAQTDTWDRANQGANDGFAKVEIQRIAFDHTEGPPPKLYAYYRTVTYDSMGAKRTMSAETRITVDITEPCP